MTGSDPARRAHRLHHPRRRPPAAAAQRLRGPRRLRRQPVRRDSRRLRAAGRPRGDRGRGRAQSRRRLRRLRARPDPALRPRRACRSPRPPSAATSSGPSGYDAPPRPGAPPRRRRTGRGRPGLRHDRRVPGHHRRRAQCRGLRRRRALGLSATATWWLVGVFQQTALGVAFSAIGRALMPKPRSTHRGVKQQRRLGEDAPGTIILGRYATAGDLVYAGRTARRTSTYSFVLELGDLPGAAPPGDGQRRLGHPLGQPRTARRPRRGRVPQQKGKDRLWIQVFDGTADRTASSYLLDTFGDDPYRPWQADMVGRGIPYAVVSASFDPRIAPRRAGGALRARRRAALRPAAGQLGRRRRPAALERSRDLERRSATRPTRTRSSRSTTSCSGCATRSTGAHLWGGSDIAQRDLPVASWFAAMNECDRGVPGEGGRRGAAVPRRHRDRSRGRDRAGGRHRGAARGLPGPDRRGGRRLGDPAGPPGAAVFAFSDDDVIVTSPEELDPFPGLDQVFNGVSRQLPRARGRLGSRRKPRSGSTRPTTPRTAAGCRWRRPQPSRRCRYRAQVQRLMASALKDGRRFRRHTVVLPPEARALGPLDVVAWTSLRNGYATSSSPSTRSRTCQRLRRGLALREVDPADYDFAAGELLPTASAFSAGRRGCRGRSTSAPRASACPTLSGTGRRPAIRLDWNPGPRAAGVRWRYRLLALADQVPLAGGARLLRRRPDQRALRLTHEGDSHPVGGVIHHGKASGVFHGGGGWASV